MDGAEACKWAGATKLLSKSALSLEEDLGGGNWRMTLRCVLFLESSETQEE